MAPMAAPPDALAVSDTAVTLEPARLIVAPALTFESEIAPSPWLELFTARAVNEPCAVASPSSTMSPPVEVSPMEVKAFRGPAVTPPPVRLIAPPPAVTAPSVSAPAELTVTPPPAVSGLA